jgi:hypothetical protein
LWISSSFFNGAFIFCNVFSKFAISSSVSFLVWSIFNFNLFLILSR